MISQGNPFTKKNLLGELVRFCFVGVVATILHYTLYWLLKHWIDINLSFIIGYVLSFLCNYILSARVTFKTKIGVGNGLGFSCSHLINLGLQVLFLNLFLKLGLSDNIAPLPVYAICVPINFILVRFFFKKLDYALLGAFLRKPPVALVLLTVLIVSLGLMPDWIQYGFFFVGGDFADQQIPFILETKRMLSSGVPFWSWNTFFGENFIAAYSFYTLTSPFVWINCLFPYNLVPQSITFTLYLKFIGAALSCYLFLRKMRISGHWSLLGGLLYTFSSYTILNINFYHFFEPLICFPLLLTAIEHFLAQERHGASLLVGTSFLCAFINWYFIPCSFISAALYAFCRCSDIQGGFCKYKRLFVGFALMGIGLLASSFILFPSFVHLARSSRAIPSLGVKLTSYDLLAWLQQVRSLFFPKVEEAGSVSPWIFNSFTSSSANLAVIGILPTALYVIKHKNWLSRLIVISIILFITPLNGVFSFFTNPLYSRWAYALSLFLILASVKFFDEGGIISKKAFGLYIAVALLICAFFYFPVVWSYFRFGSFPPTNRWVVDLLIIGVFLASLIGLAILWWKQSFPRFLWVICVFCVIHLSVRILGRTDYVYKKTGSSHAGVFDTYLTSDYPRGKPAFEFRTDFLTREEAIYANMPLLKNYPGITSYNSVVDERLKTLMASVYTHNKDHWSILNPNLYRTSLDALMSVRKIVRIKDDASLPVQINGLRPLLDNDRYLEYDSDYYIPIGFTYDSYLTEDEFLSPEDSINKSDLPLQLLANLVVKSNDVSQVAQVLQRGDPSSSFSLDSLVQQRRKTTCSNFVGNTKGAQADIFLDKDNFVFFSIPSDPGFAAFVDGKPTPIINANLGLSAVFANQGQHHIEFKYFPRGLREGLGISVIMFILMTFIYVYEKKKQT